jgi:peptidoglycan/xylan/chitin deacetylase (PgdA/CDA1 family)
MRPVLNRHMKRLIFSLGLVFLSASLGSCGSDKSRLSSPTAGGYGPVKTMNNAGYRTPPLNGPVPRNPDMNLRADFPRGVGISFSKVPVTDKYIAITFDDGPHPQNTPRLLDMPRARNIKATFYVVGRNVDLYPQVVRRAVAEGHEIGNHSYSHRLFSKMGDSEIRDELNRTRDAIARAAGVQPRTLRPPYGGLLQRQREWVNAEFGYPTILWSVDPLDWQRPGTSAVCSRILTKTTAGSIILAHDLHAQTVSAMPATLDGLLQRGFKFVTVSQLLAMKAAPLTAQAAVQTPAP